LQKFGAQMRLLLSFVNSTISLAGYDWDRGEIFWSVPSSQLKTCGFCYHNSDLWVSSDDRVVQFCSNGDGNVITLSGPYDPQLHGIHVLDDDTIGVVDTGHSAVRIIDKSGQQMEILNPVASWLEVPQDAIHLNDFVMTPYGLYASCFDYRPWRVIRERISHDDWCTGGYGLIINLTGNARQGAGRIVGCGYNHPHSLNYEDPLLYVCSSSTGTFSICDFSSTGTLIEKSQHKITEDHFLRGACFSDSGWFLGGSTFRHNKLIAENIEIYYFDIISQTVQKKEIQGKGEIYDILPWNDEIMNPIIKHHFSQSLTPRIHSISTSRVAQR
jgi:hypothetical protein